MVTLPGEGSFLFENLDDAGIRLEDIFADEFRQPTLLGVAPVVIDRREEREPAFHAEMVVVLAMPWGDVNAARAGIQRHKSRCVDRRMAWQERVAGLEAFQGGAGESFFDGDLFSTGGRAERIQKRLGEDDRFFHTLETHPGHGVLVAGIDGDGEVRGKCPRRGGPDDDRGRSGEFSADEREHDIDCGRGFILILHLRFGEGGLRTRAPEDGFFLAIDEAFFHETGEGADHAGLVGRIEREVGMLPVAQNAQSAKLTALDVDKFAGVFLRAAAHLGGREACGGFHHAELDRKTVAIPTRNKRRPESRHRATLHNEVLENLI